MSRSLPLFRISFVFHLGFFSSSFEPGVSQRRKTGQKTDWKHYKLPNGLRLSYSFQTPFFPYLPSHVVANLYLKGIKETVEEEGE